MKILNYLVFRILIFSISIIPFVILYKISDVVAWLMQHTIKYRLRVIAENLERVYPNMTSEESSILISKIYKNLADITLEGLKGITMSTSEISKRHKFINPAILNELHEKGKSVVLVAGHYNNWEWGAFSPTYYLKHQVVAFFKPLTNRYINSYIVGKRGNSGSKLADINKTKQFFEEYADKTSVFLMAADQSPTKPELAIWADFLGVKTPCLHGIEKYVEKYDLAVVFCDIQRVGRGFYELELSWLKTDQVEFAKEYGATTIAFVNKLEKIILEKPENWLWSHRRWKHADKYRGE